MNQGEFETQTYCDSFLTKVYQYYLNKGYRNIILKQIMNLISTCFLILFTLFLFNCVHFKTLVHMDTKTSLKDLISWNHFFGGVFSILCFIILMGFILLKLIKLYSSAKAYKHLKDFYNLTLNIEDNELLRLSWNHIVHRISDISSHESTNEYHMAQKIMRKDNYIIALFSCDILNSLWMTRLIEWNFIYYIINHFFNYNGHLKATLFTDNTRYEMIDNIKRRLKIMSFVYLLFMPFIFIFLGFHSIFKYGERFYNKPELLIGRQWSIPYTWRFREYNELEHLFKKRLHESNKYTREYLNQFRSKKADTIARCFIFIISALLIVLIIFSFINEYILLKLYISEDKTTLWYIGVLGSLLTLCRTFVVKKRQFEPHLHMKKLDTYLRHIPRHWIAQANKSHIKQEIVQHYEYQIISIMKECAGVIFIPYILYHFCNHIESIAHFILHNTSTDQHLGRICSYSQFSNLAHDHKLQSSLLHFKEDYPKWATQWDLCLSE